MFGGGIRNEGGIGEVWANISIFFKLILVSVLAFSLIGIITIFFNAIFIMIPSLVFRFQIWRLFTSWLVQQQILNTIIGLLNLYYYLPALQKKFSTAYMIIDFIVNNFIIQLVICICQFVGSFVTDKLNLFGAGIWGMWMVYLSKKSYQTPEVQRQFCCFPFSIKSKYFPLGFMILFSLLGSFRPDLIIAFGIGVITYSCFNNLLIKYPAKLVTGLQKCLPQSIKRRPDFVTTNSCRNELIAVCSGNIPINQEVAPEVVAGTGAGVVLGSNSNNVRQQNFRDYWASKQTQSPNQINRQMQDTVNSQRQFK